MADDEVSAVPPIELLKRVRNGFGDLRRRAMAGILPKNLRDAIQRSIDHAVQVFWNGIRVDRPGV